MIAAAALAGCASAATLETAHSLPGGRSRFVIGGAAGAGTGNEFVYERQHPPSGDGPRVETAHRRATALVSAKIQHGIGAGGQIHAGLSNGLSGIFGGLKWQLWGLGDSPFAAAILGQGAVNCGGFSLESECIALLQADVPLTFRITEHHQLTVTPRVLLGYFWRTDPYGEELEMEETVTDRSRSFGASVLWTSWDEPGEAGWIYEVEIRRVPRAFNESSAISASLAVGVLFASF